MKYILLIFIFFNLLADDSNLSKDDSFLDEYHKGISSTIKDWGVSADNVVVDFYNLFDMNVTKEEEFPLSHHLKSKKNISESEFVDEMFLSRKYLEDRDRSFVRVSLVQVYNSLQEDKFTYSIRAKIGLGQSKKRLKLFIEDFNKDSSKNIGKRGEEDSPSVGVEIMRKKIFGIKPKYSAGFKGIDPFVRARYTYETTFGIWKFEPRQTFIYSVDDEFSEETQVFLDTPTSKLTLLRFAIDRGTQSRVAGTHYDGFIQWFWTPTPKKGLSVNLGFNANTRYSNAIANDYVDDDTSLNVREENKVYNYLYLMRWRENIFKYWIFYDIGAGVNYHEVHEYRPNYNIYFGLDFFFGHV